MSALLRNCRLKLDISACPKSVKSLPSAGIDCLQETRPPTTGVRCASIQHRDSALSSIVVRWRPVAVVSCPLRGSKAWSSEAVWVYLSARIRTDQAGTVEDQVYCRDNSCSLEKLGRSGAFLRARLRPPPSRYDEGNHSKYYCAWTDPIALGKVTIAMDSLPITQFENVANDDESPCQPWFLEHTNAPA
jgi:hypothetical protein